MEVMNTFIQKSQEHNNKKNIAFGTCATLSSDQPRPVGGVFKCPEVDCCANAAYCPIMFRGRSLAIQLWFIRKVDYIPLI